MDFLYWLFGSDKNIKIPNVEKSDTIKVDFSGTYLQYNQPNNSSYSPSIFAPKEFDLFNTSLYESQSDGSWARMFARCSWNFYGKRKCGGVTAHKRILYFENRVAHSFSCFNGKDIRNELLIFCHDVWGGQNNAKFVGDGGEGYVRYPIRVQDISSAMFNSVCWAKFSTCVRGDPPRTFFAAPLSHYHMLLIDFECSAYEQVDYYSPVTNLKESCETFIDQYMQHVFLELSEAAKREKAEAPEPLVIAGA